MELAKKPVRFLFKGDAPTFRISVPKTEHSYLFYRNQPYLVKFDLDIEFFRGHLMFNEVDAENFEEVPIEEQDESKPELKPGESLETERQPYSKAELKKMRKTDLREILEKLSPGKSCPVRKDNIIKSVLEAQEK